MAIKVIIDGNTVYEVDETCLESDNRRKQNRQSHHEYRDSKNNILREKMHEEK